MNQLLHEILIELHRIGGEEKLIKKVTNAIYSGDIESGVSLEVNDDDLSNYQTKEFQKMKGRSNVL